MVTINQSYLFHPGYHEQSTSQGLLSYLSWLISWFARWSWPNIGFGGTGTQSWSLSLGLKMLVVTSRGSMDLEMFTLNDDKVNQNYLRIHDLAIWLDAV